MENQTDATTDVADAKQPLVVQRVVISCCYGGFGISDAAYEKLIEWGVPVRAYKEPARDPNTKLFLPEPANDGEVIFDRDLSKEDPLSAAVRSVSGRYWETWLSENRTHPLLVRVVEELGEAADGPHAKLKIVEVPADVSWTIEEYDGNEHVAESHRTWV